MNNDTTNPPPPLSSREILTVEELAQRLQVSRATLFTWMQKGILALGRHYFKYGRVVRFVWSDCLLETLLADSACQDRKEAARAAVRTVRQAKAAPINWEY